METSTFITSSTSLAPSQEYSDIVSEAVYPYLVMVFKFCLFPLFALIGLCANIINVIVFYKMGLSDGVTQNYFILSLSDGLFALFNLINAVAFIVFTIGETYKKYRYLEVDAHIVYRLSYFMILVPQLVSLVVTVVIAVVRSCCVAMPLQVKHIITRKRQLAAILILAGTIVTLLVVSFSPMRLITKYNPQTKRNISFFKGETRAILAPLVNASFIGGFIIVVISVFIIARGLRQASKFRDSSTTKKATSGSKKEPLEQADSAAGGKAKERRQRDIRIVRTVVMVSVVFIITNIPDISFALMKLFVKGFGPLERYKYAHSVTLMVGKVTTTFGAAVNIFIYFFFNSRYRTTLSSLFRGEKINK